MNLPVSEVLQTLLTALRTSPQVVLQAPPGAGKSTWLPLQLLNCDWITGKIIMLEPRRLAARNVAQRLAQQLGQRAGETVGYRMRAESCVGSTTRLEVVTEGILTRMLQRDPALEPVSLVILDEYHERSLQADLALALLLDVQQGLRDDLRILIMSATLDTLGLEALLPQSQVVQSAGRGFPVQQSYFPLSANQMSANQHLEDAVTTAIVQMVQQFNGSLLAFLPGVAEIRRVEQRLQGRIAESIKLCPLYGALSLHDQQQAILPLPDGQRKIVLATNIAETSLTIDGISLIVDSALERTTGFDSRTGLTRLFTQRISKASMTQRAGRAGRLSAGICWHLLSKEKAERAAENGQPEILQTDLSGFYLELLLWGCTDFSQLKLLTPPPQPAVDAAKRLLKLLGAVDERGQLTRFGREMAMFGCEPRLAAMLVYAKALGNDAMVTATRLVAILEEPPRSGSTDLHYWLTHIQSGWLRRSEQLAARLNVNKGRVDPSLAAELLAVAFPDRIAAQRGNEGRYLLANGSGAMMDADDALTASPWLIAANLLSIAQASNARIRLAVSCDPEQLITHFPHLMTETTGLEWNESLGTLRTLRRRMIGQIVISQQSLAKPSRKELSQALLSWIREQGVSKLPWDESAQQLKARIECAQQWLPEYSWPAVDDDALLVTLEDWLLPALNTVQDVKSLQNINLAQALMHRLDWQQKQRLDSLLPDHYVLPTGTSAPIRYNTEGAPILSVRLQEVFGERQSPRVASGRISLVLELLSPARRPLQITGDLAAFWQGAYLEVKKEMKGRYPKHVWPDDPANALPTNRTKRFTPSA